MQRSAPAAAVVYDMIDEFIDAIGQLGALLADDLDETADRR